LCDRQRVYKICNEVYKEPEGLIKNSVFVCVVGPYRKDTGDLNPGNLICVSIINNGCRVDRKKMRDKIQNAGSLEPGTLK